MYVLNSTSAAYSTKTDATIFLELDETTQIYYKYALAKVQQAMQTTVLDYNRSKCKEQFYFR